MSEHKLSKGQLVGCIALCLMVVAFTGFLIYTFRALSITISATFDSWSTVLNDDKIFTFFILIIVIITLIVWLAGVSSLIYRCIILSKGNSEFIILHMAIQTACAFFASAATHFMTVISGWGLGGLWGRNDSAAVAFHIFCFVLFFITATISLTLLYLNTIYKKQMNRKLMMVNYIGLAVTVVLSLIIFIPDFICVLIVSY